MRTTDSKFIRSSACEAVIAFRRALNKTQQSFALEVIKCAVMTIARWETSQGPRGDALLTLAAAADAHGQQSIGDRFRKLFLVESWEKIGRNLYDPDTGLLFVSLTTPQAKQEAIALLRNLLRDVAA